MTAADSPTPPPQQPAGTNWTVGRILLVILGCIVALLAAGLLAAGGTLLWADLTQRDDDGFLTTPTERFTSDSFAITSDSIDLFEADTHGDWVLSEGVLGEVRITGENAQGDVFIGIADTDDVDAYLDGVAHDEVRDLDFDPFSVDYRRFPGGEPPGPPADQSFWAASATGSGTQNATWEAESGDWTIVVMSADASRGVAADVSMGAEANFLIWLAIGLLIAGGAPARRRRGADRGRSPGRDGDRPGDRRCTRAAGAAPRRPAPAGPPSTRWPSAATSTRRSAAGSGS